RRPGRSPVLPRMGLAAGHTMRRMRFAIAIHQFYADGEFDPAAFRAYLTRAEELGFDSAWAQEQVLGVSSQFGPLEAMTYAAACTQGCGWGAWCSCPRCTAR